MKPNGGMNLAMDKQQMKHICTISTSPLGVSETKSGCT